MSKSLCRTVALLGFTKSFQGKKRDLVELARGFWCRCLTLLHDGIVENGKARVLTEHRVRVIHVGRSDYLARNVSCGWHLVLALVCLLQTKMVKIKGLFSGSHQWASILERGGQESERVVSETQRAPQTITDYASQENSIARLVAIG